MKKPSKDFSSRYARAKKWRNAAEPHIREVLRFCAPGRQNDFDKKANDTHDYDADTYTALPEELALDFASDLVTYFTPAEARWSEYLVTAPVSEDEVDAVQEIVDDRENVIFELIQSSNYNDTAPQILFECCHGTTAMWVDSAHLTQPVFVESIPPNELLITPGHLGYLDRFREKSVMTHTLPALLDGWDVDLSDRTLAERIKKPDDSCKVCWGFWLDWTDPGNPFWRAEVTIDGKCVSEPAMEWGPMAGGCPLLVGRFNPEVGRPWGRGPGRKALPDMRVLDKIDDIMLTAMDQATLPTLIYPDDGFLDLSEGVEAGRAYPAGRGFDRNQIFELQRGANLDHSFFSEEHIEQRIRTAFYQDGPRQRGETPPTASQWLDERRRVQQRIGKPSAPLWKEFFLPFIQRVEYLAVQAGRLEATITHNEQVITVLPVSPLQKAQNQDKVLVSRSNLDLAFAVAGEQTPAVVDLFETFKNIVHASGDELTVIRKEDDAPAPPDDTGAAA